MSSENDAPAKQVQVTITTARTYTLAVRPGGQTIGQMIDRKLAESTNDNNEPRKLVIRF